MPRRPEQIRDHAVIRNDSGGRPYIRVVHDPLKKHEVVAVDLNWEEAGQMAENLCVLFEVMES